MDSDEKLIIALDFGTTYSGVAYGFANQAKAVPVAIKHWPDNHGISVPKIPTLVEYEPGSGTKRFKWGSSVNNMNEGVVNGVKLLLDPSQKVPSYLKEEEENISRGVKNLPKPAVEIAADFIGSIYAHALKEIAKTAPKEYLDICGKEYVLSVPAVWSDAAKNATLKAAQMAGIHPVTIVKEPEAAALYSIKILDFSIKRDDNFVVCDAGGGTVDLISYQVEATSPRLQLKELVPGTGGMAGSTGLNRRFAAAVHALVGDDQWLVLKNSKSWVMAERQFDREIKPAFEGDEDAEFFVNFPLANLKDDPSVGLVSNTWTLTGTELTWIFEPLIRDIVMMIKDQVQSVQLKRPNNGVKAILLVGGFGSSQYLLHRVRRKFPGIQVLQPDDAWAAIVKGGVLCKLPGQAAVTSVTATHNYGVKVGMDYDSNRHKGRQTYESPDGFNKVVEMQWFIKRGEEILRDQRITHRYKRDSFEPYYGQNLIFVAELWQHPSDKAPAYPQSGETMNCKARCDLRGIPESHIKLETNLFGRSYYSVSYDLVITIKSAIMTFSCEIDGETMGSVEVDYD